MWDAPGKQRRAGDWEWGQGGGGGAWFAENPQQRCLAARHGTASARAQHGNYLRRPKARSRRADACPRPDIIPTATWPFTTLLATHLSHPPPPPRPRHRHPHCTPPPHGTQMVPQPPTSLLLLPSPARHHPWRLPWPPRPRSGSGGSGGSIARLLGFPRPFCALVHPFPAPGCPCFRGASPSALSMVDVSGHRRWGGCGGG